MTLMKLGATLCGSWCI